MGMYIDTIQDAEQMAEGLLDYDFGRGSYCDFVDYLYTNWDNSLVDEDDDESYELQMDVLLKEYEDSMVEVKSVDMNKEVVLSLTFEDIQIYLPPKLRVQLTKMTNKEFKRLCSEIGSLLSDLMYDNYTYYYGEDYYTLESMLERCLSSKPK